MTATVLVVCDNPKHARGKVAKIVTFMVDLAAGTVEPVPIKRERRMTNYREGAWKSIAKAANAGAEHEEDFAPHMKNADWLYFTKGIRYPYLCKLCGRSVPHGDELDAAVRGLASDGVTSASLSHLLSIIDRNAER